ncbi:restriction endonuclease [Pistricoccus aurantiacus]|uniref:restriction endonuclease n=1 Tax=Pistricoccus aurantiacus TaxID=1883414 RepID=UPI0036375A23
MAYYNPLVSSCLSSFEVLELERFVDFYFDFTHGFSNLPTEANEVWCLISEGSSWVTYLGKYNEEKTKVTIGIDELNARVAQIKRETGKKLSKCTGENAEDFIALTLSTIDLDGYIPGGMLNFMNEESSASYLKLKKRIDSKLSAGTVKRQDWEDLVNISCCFYSEVNCVYDAHRDILSDIPHIAAIFKNKKIKLSNGEYDYKRINSVCKKELAQDKKHSILIVARMIDKLLALETGASEPTPTNVEIGNHLESLVANLYRKLGYTVTETPATSDFGIDLIAKSNSGLVGIQCKNYLGNVGVDAVMQAHSGALYYDCKNSVVVASNGFTKAAYQMANKLNVELLVLTE